MSNPNVELSRRWFEEVGNQRRLGIVDELLTPESVGHMEGADVVGREGFKRAHAEFVTAFPDLRIAIDGVIANGDDVVVRWTATGTHTGSGFGGTPTGRVVSFRGMTWHRYRGGKLVEGWDNWDQTGLMTGCGMVKTRGAS